MSDRPAYSPEMRRALDEARERGRATVARIFNGDDMRPAAAFAKLLGTSVETLEQMRRQNLVIGIGGPSSGYRFPIWQLDTHHKPFAARDDGT